MKYSVGEHSGMKLDKNGGIILRIYAPDLVKLQSWPTPIGERWLFILNGDMSAGGSDLIWTAQALGGWRFGSRKQSSLLLGYRHRALDYSKADKIDVKRTFTGPIMGLQIGF